MRNDPNFIKDYKKLQNDIHTNPRLKHIHEPKLFKLKHQYNITYDRNGPFGMLQREMRELYDKEFPRRGSGLADSSASSYASSWR